jgi:hypothetical protein
MSGGFAGATSAKFAGLTGTATFFDDERASTPGSEQTLVSESVPVGKKWTLYQLQLNSSRDAKIQVKIGSTLVGSGTIGAGDNNLFFSWFPGRPMAATETVTVLYDQNSSTPTTTVRAHLQLTEENA